MLSHFAKPVICTVIFVFSQKNLIHSDYFYSDCSTPLLLRGAPDTAWTLCRSFTPKHHRQLGVKDLPKVPMWQLDSNTRPFGRKATNLPMSYNAPQLFMYHAVSFTPRKALSRLGGCSTQTWCGLEQINFCY